MNENNYRKDQNNEKVTENDVSDINRFTMDGRGNIKRSGHSSATYSINPKILIVLGWITAGLTAFISPLFAVAGISFGVLANKEIKGSGNAVIIATIVLAVINLIFGLILVSMMKKMMPLY